MAERDYEALKAQVEESINKSRFKPSKQMTEVLDALKDVCALRGEVVDEKTNLKPMLEAHKRLGEACDAYTKSRKNAKTDKGKNRLDLVGTIYSLQQQERDGINAMRSPKSRHDNEGKTWNDVLASQRERTLDITGKTLKTVGAGSSTRTVVEMGGDIGFFSEESVQKPLDETFHSLANQISRPKVKALADKVADGCKRNSENHNIYLNVYSIAQDYTEMKDIDEQMRNMNNLRPFWNEFSEEDKKEFANFTKEIHKADTAYGAMDSAGIKEGCNISNRNIATTRLAELLGQDNLIAHSEKLCLIDGEHKIHGVVMARAEGIDINSSSPEDKEIFSQPIEYSNPEFQRQITSLEIMDLLSGQVDRHPGNMFYQFGDMVDGKRSLNGIQGIDNDAAFGEITRLDHISDFTSLDHVTMIDTELKRNLLDMNRDVLDYTFGDVLNSQELDAMENRLVQLQKHAMQNMKEMQPEDWNQESAEKLVQTRGYLPYLQGIIAQDNLEAQKNIPLEKENAEKSDNKKKPEKRQLEEPETAAHEKADVEKAPTESSAKPEKSSAESEKQMETKKPEKHERKEIPLNDLEDMVKSDRKMENAQKEKEAPKADHQWERRSPSVPLNTGRRLHGELGIGQHHRTPGGPSR